MELVEGWNAVIAYKCRTELRLVVVLIEREEVEGQHVYIDVNRLSRRIARLLDAPDVDVEMA